MINHVYQKKISNSKYLFTRAAKSSEFQKLIHHIAEKIPHRDENILILGCNSGENDLLPLIKELECRRSGHYKIFTIDDSDSILYSVEKIKKRKFRDLNIDYNKKWQFRKNNIEITLLQEDIEAFPQCIFSNKFHIVIAFFVLNHLTNWQLCINQICKSLTRDGRFFITEYNDKLIEAIENNNINFANSSSCSKKGNILNSERTLNSFDLIYEYHKERFRKFNIFYSNSLIGSNINSLKNYLSKDFIHEVVCNIKYEENPVVISREDIKLRLDVDTAHTPIFWGQEVNPISEEVTNNYNIFTKKFLSFKNFPEHVKYDGCLILHEFQKIFETFSEHSSMWDSNFRITSEQIYRLVEIPENEKFDPTRAEILLMQIILQNQGLFRGTQFFTTLFWGLTKKSDVLKIDLSDTKLSFLTLLSSRSYSEVYKKYINHLLVYRTHDTSVNENGEKYSLAEAIFDHSKADINWILTLTEGDFNCEIIKNGIMKFFVLKIPMKYLGSQIKTEDEDILGMKVDFALRFNNFICADLSNNLDIKKFNEYESDRIARLNLKLYNLGLIDKEHSERLAKLQRVLDDEIWNHLTKHEKIKFANMLARRAPRFAYLLQLGSCIYITNKLFNKILIDKENGLQIGERVTSNGGFLFCEKIDMQELKDPNSFTSLRYKFLEEVADIFSSKVNTPHILRELTEKDILRIKLSKERLIAHHQKHIFQLINKLSRDISYEPNINKLHFKGNFLSVLSTELSVTATIRQLIYMEDRHHKCNLKPFFAPFSKVIKNILIIAYFRNKCDSLSNYTNYKDANKIGVYVEGIKILLFSIQRFLLREEKKIQNIQWLEESNTDEIISNFCEDDMVCQLYISPELDNYKLNVTEDDEIFGLLLICLLEIFHNYIRHGNTLYPIEFILDNSVLMIKNVIAFNKYDEDVNINLGSAGLGTIRDTLQDCYGLSFLNPQRQTIDEKKQLAQYKLQITNFSKLLVPKS